MMLNDHIYDTELALFRAGRLPAVRTIEVADHLEGCMACRERFDLVGARAWMGVPVAPELCFRDDHPDGDQFSEYLDGELDAEERELIDSHIRICDSCAGDLVSLRYSRIENDAAIERRYFESRPLTWLANLRMHFGIVRPAVVFGVLVVILIAVVWLLDSRGTPEAPVVKNPPPPIVPEPVRDEQPAGDLKREYTVAVIDGGRKVGLDAEGRLVGFGWMPAGLERDVARVLEGRPLKVNPILEDLRTPDGVARSAPGEPEPLRLIGPLETVVREVRPRFRWTPREGAVSCSVTVTDDRFNVVAESGPVEGVEWSPEVDLERGRVYQWQVTAWSGDQPVESRLDQVGLFKVIGARELESIERVEAEVRSSLARAVLYAGVGLIGEADKELRKLESNNPRMRERLRRAVLPSRLRLTH